MSGRDHSETCGECGMQRGGLNNYVCNCELAAESRRDGVCLCEARMAGECMCGAWDDNAGMAVRGLASDAMRERDRLRTLLDEATRLGAKLAGLECCSESEARITAIRKEAGLP